MKDIPKKVMIILLKIYKIIISDYLYMVLGGGCKYHKTCSEFAIDAVNEWGIIKGLRQSLKRFLSCQPFSGKYYATIKDIN